MSMCHYTARIDFSAARHPRPTWLARALLDPDMADADGIRLVMP